MLLGSKVNAFGGLGALLWECRSIAFGVREHSWFLLHDWLQLRDTSRPYI